MHLLALWSLTSLEKVNERLGMVMHTWNPSTQDAEAEASLCVLEQPVYIAIS